MRPILISPRLHSKFFLRTQKLKRLTTRQLNLCKRSQILRLKNGLKKEDIATGVLTVAPVYGGDCKKKVRSYNVQSQVVLKVKDFSHIGPILDASVEDGVTDFRSLSYSLSDEEA